MKYAADLLVETLAAAGVERIYGITGDSANHITDAVERSAIRFVHTRHEEVAAMAAGAEAAATGKLAVCLGSCGPGSLHLVNGLYDAHRNGSPVLALATEIPLGEIGTRYVQEIDTHNLFAGCSHYCASVQTVEQLPRILGIAMQTAISRGGVAVVIISGTISSEKIEAHIKPSFLPHYTRPRITPSAEEIALLADSLNSGGKITIYGGYGCRDAERQVAKLSEKIKAPVAWSARAIDILDHSMPYSAGMMGILGTSAGAFAVGHCDTLLVLGSGYAFSSSYPDKARIIQIDISGENLSRRHDTALGFVGDVAPTLDELLPLIRTRNDMNFAMETSEIYRIARGHLLRLTLQPLDSHRATYPERLTAMLDERISPTAWVTSDMGTPWAFATRYMTSAGSRRFYTSSLHGTMGAAMPAAIGLSAAMPEVQVVALCGDGGLSMSLGDLITVREEGLRPKIFVYNNSRLDFVAMEMKADGLLDSKTELGHTSYADIAAAIGLHSIRVERTADLAAAIDEAFAYDGAVVVDVVVDGDSMLIPPQITSEMVGKFSLYAAKMVMHSRSEELLAEAMVNLRGM